MLVEGDTKYFYVCFLRDGFLAPTNKEAVNFKAILQAHLLHREQNKLRVILAEN